MLLRRSWVDVSADTANRAIPELNAVGSGQSCVQFFTVFAACDSCQDAPQVVERPRMTNEFFCFVEFSGELRPRRRFVISLYLTDVRFCEWVIQIDRKHYAVRVELAAHDAGQPGEITKIYLRFRQCLGVCLIAGR